MLQLRHLISACLAVLALACTSAPAPQVAPTPTALEAGQPALVLISLDGFRHDFLDHGVTPNLSRLATEGVHAERLIPSFPTKTFPNHYTVVTGLRPSEHGLVANNIWDPDTEESFGLSNREAVGNGAWYGGEPIWVTAERQGMPSAPLFWPGSEAEILGIRPSKYLTYDGDMPPADRVDLILEWLDLPPGERPGFLTLYFSNVDDAAHRNGPEPSSELAAALRTVDGAVGWLVEGLARRGLDSRVNLMIVSDHGMSSTSQERVIFLDDYIDIETVNVVDWSPILGLWPPDESLIEVYGALENAHPNMAVYRRDDIPDRFEFIGHDRIPLIVGIADDGWSISSRARFSRCPQCFDGGAHGYEQRLESMGALLIAVGPFLSVRVEIGPIENFHLYNVMCEVLGLEPAANSGDPARVAELVAPSRN